MEFLGKTMTYRLEATFHHILALAARMGQSRFHYRIRHALPGLLGQGNGNSRADAPQPGQQGNNITERQASEHPAPTYTPSVMLTMRQQPDGTTRILYASPFIEDYFGISATAVQNDASRFFGRIHASDLSNTRRSQDGSAFRMEPWHTEFRWNHPDGRELRVEIKATPEREADGGLLWHGFMYNITGRYAPEGETHPLCISAS